MFFIGYDICHTNKAFDSHLTAKLHAPTVRYSRSSFSAASLLHSREHVRVGVQSHDDGTVPKPFLHDLGMHTLSQHDRRSRVPKIVKPDVCGKQFTHAQASRDSQNVQGTQAVLLRFLQESECLSGVKVFIGRLGPLGWSTASQTLRGTIPPCSIARCSI